MAEHPNVALIRNAYASFAEGDLDGALTDLADDCVFHFGGTGPNSGDHKGRDDIAAALIKNFELTAGTQKLDIRGIYADDDHAAVVLRETATRPDGTSIDMDEVHVLRLHDGKVLDLWDLPEDIDPRRVLRWDVAPPAPVVRGSSQGQGWVSRQCTVAGLRS